MDNNIDTGVCLFYLLDLLAMIIILNHIDNKRR